MLIYALNPTAPVNVKIWFSFCRTCSCVFISVSFALSAYVWYHTFNHGQSECKCWDRSLTMYGWEALPCLEPIKGPMHCFRHDSGDIH